MIPINEAIKLIRRSNILKDWTDLQIKCAISNAAKTGALAYTRDAKGRLKSIVFGNWHGSCYHCSALVAHGELNLFLRYLKDVYPFCDSLTYQRKGKLKSINIKKL